MLILSSYVKMASISSQFQRRRVFVGNIPYGATEEIIDICKEIGPVVSFRIFRILDSASTDEETALSALHNLKGYEFRGRRLRVAFADNDKNANKDQEKGRRGFGTVPSHDPPKQAGGCHEAVGKEVAKAAATVMGGDPNDSTQDALTRTLAELSRSKMTSILSQFKEMAAQDEEKAHQMLIAFPNFARALYQVEIMHGIVSQEGGTAAQNSQPSPVQSARTLQQNKTQLGLSLQESQVSAASALPYVAEKRRMVDDSTPEQFDRSQKTAKLNDGTAHPLEILSGVDRNLLEAVVNLRAQQLSSMPPEEQQQVILLQQTLPYQAVMR